MFRSLECSLWDDPKVRALSPPAKLLFLYAITCRHSHVSGAYYLPDLYAAHETGLEPRVLVKAWQELIDAEVVLRDGDMVWVRRMFRYQGRGPKVAIAAARHLQTLHRSTIVGAFLAEYPEVGEYLPDAFVAGVERSGAERSADTPSAAADAVSEESDESTPGTFGEAFAVWRESLPEAKRAGVRPTKPRRAKYAARRAEGYSHEEILDALRGWVHDPWPGRREEATAYDMATLLRDGKQVEKFGAMWRERAPAIAKPATVGTGGVKPGTPHPLTPNRVWDGQGYLPRERWDVATVVYVGGQPVPRAEWEARCASR